MLYNFCISTLLLSSKLRFIDNNICKATTSETIFQTLKYNFQIENATCPTILSIIANIVFPFTILVISNICSLVSYKSPPATIIHMKHTTKIKPPSMIFIASMFVLWLLKNKATNRYKSSQHSIHWLHICLRVQKTT